MKVALVLAILAATAAAFVPYDNGLDNAAWYSLIYSPSDLVDSVYIENMIPGEGTPFQPECNPYSGPYGAMECYSHTLGDAVHNEGMCYVYLYPERGCSGMPLQALGARDTTIAGVDDHILWFDHWNGESDYWSYTYWDWTVFDNSPLAGFYVNNYFGSGATAPLEGNFPVGCTDVQYLPYLQMITPMNREFYESNRAPFTVKSALVICNGELECPRNCENVACGVYDDCNMPCVGYCDAGEYCAVDQSTTEFICMPAQYGTSTWFTTFNVGLAKKRSNNNEPYYEPTITHLENVLIHDLSYATDGLVPAQAIVIDSIEFNTNMGGSFNLQFTINVDTVNTLGGSTFSVEALSQWLVDNIFLDGADQGPGYLLGGPFTSFMDTSRTFPLADVSGIPTSGTTNDSDEWVDVVIPDSWLPPVVVSTSGASTLVVSWLMCVVAALLW